MRDFRPSIARAIVAPLLSITAAPIDPKAMQVPAGLRNQQGVDETQWHARNGNARALREEIASGRAQPLRVSRGGVTALMCAAWAESPECVEMLLPISNPLARDAKGRDALRYCALRGWGEDAKECLRLLLPVSDARALDRAGLSLLMRMAREGCLEGARMALPHSDPMARNPGGLTALGLVPQDAPPELRSLLLSAEEALSLGESVGEAPRAVKRALGL